MRTVWPRHRRFPDCSCLPGFHWSCSSSDYCANVIITYLHFYFIFPPSVLFHFPSISIPSVHIHIGAWFSTPTLFLHMHWSVAALQESQGSWEFPLGVHSPPTTSSQTWESYLVYMSHSFLVVTSHVWACFVICSSTKFWIHLSELASGAQLIIPCFRLYSMFQASHTHCKMCSQGHAGVCSSVNEGMVRKIMIGCWSCASQLDWLFQCRHPPELKCWHAIFLKKIFATWTCPFWTATNEVGGKCSVSKQEAILGIHSTTGGGR